MLTDVQIRQAVPRDKDYKLADSGGLYLFVAKSGRKSWRWKYRYAGKEQRLIFGAYPDMKLSEARNRRDASKIILKSGKDPQLEAKRAQLLNKARAAETFEKFARQWFEAQKSRWKPVHAADVIESLERDLFPTLGPYPIAEIDEPLLLAALQAVENRGSIETARRLRQRAERIFKFARASGAGNLNPAVDVKEAMQPVPKKRRWPAITNLDKLQAFLRTVERMPSSPVTRLASRILALTAQRPGMVRGMAWSEIENVDWARPAAASPKALWRVPSGRMKLEFDLREDQAWDHLVPLAPAAVEVLQAVRQLTVRGTMVFPSARDAHDPMSENAIGYLYNRVGYKGVHVPHGWRAAFSTIMNGRMERAHPGANRLIIDRLIIDLMLAHVPVGMSAEEFTYNRSAYIERRRELACEWADILLAHADPAAAMLTGPRRRKVH